MIIHLFPKSKFLGSYVDFINKYFNKNNHLFVVYSNGPEQIPDNLYQVQNVIDYDTKNTLWLLKESKKAEKIIFHNLSVNIYELFMFFLHPQLVQKSVWFIWGGDLYCYRNKREKIIDKLVELMRKCVIANFPIIATLTVGDYEIAKKWYKINARNVRLDYLDEKELQVLQNCKKSGIKDKSVIRILVGNSATHTNCHREVLELLAKYRDENIEIYAPLSYGDMTYADEIENLGKKYFGQKFIAIKEFMDFEKYYSLLDTMDVAIFYNDRQQAIGNIMALAYLEKKIYLREGTSMWDEWVVGKGYPFHSVTNIENESFEIFSRCSQNESQLQTELVMEYYDVGRRIKEWEAVFEQS